jgi:hypothetical protein
MVYRPGKDLGGRANDHQPGAAERTKARVDATEAKKQRRKGRRRGGTLTIEFDLPFRAYLRDAAETRNMGINGYARRAVAAFIAYDLGIPFEEVTKHFAAPSKHGEVLRRDDGTPRAPFGESFDDGEGYGPWRIGSR